MKSVREYVGYGYDMGYPEEYGPVVGIPLPGCGVFKGDIQGYVFAVV